ncbi:MAG TPA: DUF5723 family protein [Candidatus Binatia bacterium]|nr:DUF5723 family protein [Candidatus Binatia bacterium]
MKNSLSSLVLCVLFIGFPVFAQENSAFHVSRWGGVLSVAQNPADVFTLDLKSDIHLFSIALAAESDYLSLHPNKLFAGAAAREVLEPAPNKETASAMIHGEVVGPSFLIRLSAKDALAFSTKDRVLVNIDSIPLDAANMLYDTLLGSGANNYSFSGEYASLNAHVWLEYAFTYGRLLFNHGPHRLKSGITLKLLQGVSSYSLTLRNFQSQLEIASELVDQFTAEVTYGHTQNLTWGNEGNGLLKNEAMGVGLDIGAVYEYSPSWAQSEKASPGGSADAHDYKFKIGFAILDLGAITYEKKLASHDFHVDVDLLDIVVFETMESQADLNAVIHSIDGVSPQPNDPGKFTMNLPARINFSLDYRVLRGVYFNLNPVIALNNGKSDPYRTHAQTMCYFSLRAEKHRLGVYVPGAIGGLGGFRLGLGFKLGPLLIGSASVLSTLLAGQTAAADVFFGLRIPLT